MGSCVSIHRGSGSAIKPSHSPESKTENLVILPSPIKNERPLARVFGSANNHVDYGSKDEAFFDSQAWFDSDCEDDFFSVNGDFTPSRGNTPVHHKFSPGINGVRKPHIEDQNRGSTAEPSPTEKRKRLSELFVDSFKDNLDDDYDDDDDDKDENESRTEVPNNGRKITQVKPVDRDLPRRPKFQHSSPRVSGANSVCSSEKTGNGAAMDLKEKPIRSADCCLPSLALYRRFGERRTKSPSVAVNA